MIRLRIAEPDLPRPYRAPFDFAVRGAVIPVPAVVGAVLTFAVWLIAIATHSGRALRRAGLACRRRSSSSSLVRRAHGEGLTERVSRADEQLLRRRPTSGGSSCR